MEKVKRICILSGSPENDLLRAKTGVDYRKFQGLDTPFRILGAGPDLNEALRLSAKRARGEINDIRYSLGMHGLDHHLGLYQYLFMATGIAPEVVTSSVTLVQNVLHGFREEDGKFAIVTEPWHYEKFERIQRVLKEKGKIPGHIGFFNVPSPDTGYYSAGRKLLSRIKSELELMTV